VSKNAILAIDGGGTRTRAGLYDEAGNLLAEAEGDATNLSRLPWPMAVRVIEDLGSTLAMKASVTITEVFAGISGAGRTGQAQATATGLSEAFRTKKVGVCSDAHMASFANLDAEHPILVIAGTGSVAIARRSDGTRVVTGGWGPVVGDEGGAYRIALEGIRQAEDDDELKRALVEAAGVKEYSALYVGLGHGPPANVADLASVVTKLAEQGNSGANRALQDQAAKLGALARHALTRAGIDISALSKLTIYVTGGAMDSELYAEKFRNAITSDNCVVTLARPRLTGHRAALELRNVESGAKFLARPGDPVQTRYRIGGTTESVVKDAQPLDSISAIELSESMFLYDVLATHAVQSAKNAIAFTIESAAACLRAGGRIIYAGAGTSGRLGVLDASECPPTFGVDEGRVIGLIAGGDEALRHSIEGAEDDTGLARKDIDAISPPVGPNDIVIGITASGTTPYALAAIDRAKELGAKTGLLACNPVPLDRADHVIALDTGPEVLPGSTRLKAGTATKIVLNQISTGAMAKAGYVFEGRMVGVQPSNNKLRRRCIRIIAELTKEDEAAAEKRLDETGGSIRLAVLMARKGLSVNEARHRLDAARGILRDALETK